MKTIKTTRMISAPLEVVFDAISNPTSFKNAVESIVSTEYLTDQQRGAGTRFRETRMMNGKEVSVDLEISEHVENQHVRMVSDSGGTVWDTIFTVEQSGDQVAMKMAMEARPHKFMARMMNFLIRPMVAKAVESDMDAIKVFCENQNVLG